MGLLELSWSQTAEGAYVLALAWPQSAEQFDREEVGRILHRHGFASLGGDFWIAPEDMAAPKAALASITAYGIATEMSVETLPPILEAELSSLPLF